MGQNAKYSMRADVFRFASKERGRKRPLVHDPCLHTQPIVPPKKTRIYSGGNSKYQQGGPRRIAAYLTMILMVWCRHLPLHPRTSAPY